MASRLKTFESAWLIQGQRCSFTASASAILVNVPQKQAAYNASKAAQVHLAKSLAVEWADFARVNCISPVSGRRHGNSLTLIFWLGGERELT